jgi:hypothetical protein
VSRRRRRPPPPLAGCAKAVSTAAFFGRIGCLLVSIAIVVTLVRVFIAVLHGGF